MTKLEEAHKAENLDEIDEAINGVNTAWSAASQEIYAASQQEAAEQNAAQGAADAEAPSSDEEEAKGDNGAVDADFEVVEDDDKK